MERQIKGSETGSAGRHDVIPPRRIDVVRPATERGIATAADFAGKTRDSRRPDVLPERERWIAERRENGIGAGHSRSDYPLPRRSGPIPPRESRRRPSVIDEPLPDLRPRSTECREQCTRTHQRIDRLRQGDVSTDETVGVIPDTIGEGGEKHD